MMLPLGRVDQNAVADATAAGRFGPAALERRVKEVREHYERVCERRADYITKNAYYYEQVFQLLRFIIPPGKRVLQVGCLTPDFLNAVAPSFGVGIDLSERQVELAGRRFPQLRFQVHKNYDVGNVGTFDYVIITDINDQADSIASLRALASVMSDQTRVIIQNYNHIWEPLLRLAEWLGKKFPLPLQNWLSTPEVANILTLCDYEPLQVYRRVLAPKKIPLLSALANSFIARLPVVERLNLICLTVARPLLRRLAKQDHSVSVVVPCRNEVGNVGAAVERIPDLGSHTEIIFCDDKSTDGTADEVRRLQQLYPGRDIKLYDGPGISKALNVRTGFDHARGDILDDSRCGPYHDAGGIALFLRRYRKWQGGVRIRVAFRVPNGRGGNAAAEYRREPVLQRHFFLRTWPKDHRYTLWHQGALAPALACNTGIDRQLGYRRSVGRLRSAFWSCQAPPPVN